ncbi:MAG TPA: hypothetical protein VI386_31590 [Candidatus Sulfotelmatobacter sp.]
MEHEEAVRQNATERYVLDELSSEERSDFETHFFDCQDCATDVRAAAVFIEHSKDILAEPPSTSPSREMRPARSRKKWYMWPALSAPVMALLLAVVGFQYITLSRLGRNAHVLPAVSLNLQTYGDNAATIVIFPGESFLVNVIIPPESRFSSYQVDLYNPKGKIDSSLPIPVSSSASTWPIQIPGANRDSGTYRLAVQGRTAEGETKDVGSSSFELKIQK